METVGTAGTIDAGLVLEKRAKSGAERLPSQIKYIVGNEAAERFSFYGMRSILVVFMVSQLAMTKPDAKAVYHLFVSAAYLLPLLGAFLADRYLGKYKTIMTLSTIYCVGHGVLAVWPTVEGMYVGLGLIALGAGGIKPCVSAHVGDQFNKSNKHLVKRVFDLFYWMINFGSFFSTLIIPWTLEAFGHQVAFGVPGILMAVATLVFWMGRNEYVHVPPAGKTGGGFVAIATSALRNLKIRKAGEDFFAAARADHSEENIDGARAAWRVLKVFATVSIFWALFDQHGSSWVLQAQQMELNFMGIQLSASQLQALNPAMVMVLIPLFAYVLYPAVERLGIAVTPLRKMGTGMFVAALSFVLVAAIQYFLDQGVKLNAMWQFFPYLILTMAEVMISITGLEFAYSQAPRSMKSTLMSFWFLTVFVGNLITAYVSKINVFTGANFFLFFAALMLGVSFIFAWSAARFQVREYFED